MTIALSTPVTPEIRAPRNWLTLTTALGYALVCAVLGIAWSVRGQNLIRAEDGLGYWLGICGASLMVLLLAYPLRKRFRALERLGSVRFWFRTHMIFGVLGPLLIVLHSNFVLGSLNGRIALFCTLIVASSGVIGRHLYGKIHYGMYGERATLQSLKADIVSESTGSAGNLLSTRLIEDALQPYEQRALARATRVLPSLIDAAAAPVVVFRLERTLRGAIHHAIESTPAATRLAGTDRARLLQIALRQLKRRLASYRKLAQLRGCERLFSLWHVVHFPLFLVMVLAAIVHVIAVHAY